jgi:predicted outer membrane protein
MDHSTPTISTAFRPADSLEFVITLALSLACAGALLTADAGRPISPAPAQAASPSDSSILTPVEPHGFVADMAQAGMVDAELAKLAVKNAASADVKALAGIIVADERENAEELTAYASELHLRVPNQPDGAQRNVVDRLAGLRDAAFDREFLNLVVQRQRERADTLAAVAIYPARALEWTHESSSRTTRLAQWSAHVLPRVRHHLTRAQELLARQG